uniref:DISC1 scaffold protein n=1 Tax=Otolemur garnettii TaxID=30611 RepID=H0X056_OTOGA
SFSSGSPDCIPPAVSSRRRLARRPGYMRSSAGPRIRFPSPDVGMPSRVPAGVRGEESHHSQSRVGRCGLGLGGRCTGLLLRSTVAPAVTSVGHPGLALTSVRGTSAGFGTQLRGGTRLPSGLTRPCGPGDAGCQQEFSSMDSCEAPDAGRDAACGEGVMGAPATGSLALTELSSNSCGLGRGPLFPSAPPGSHEAFTSSFSFIRLSLGSAEERGEAEGCPPPREAEHPRQSPQDMGTKTTGLDGPRQDPARVFLPFHLSTASGSADSAWDAASSPRPECEVLSSLVVDTESLCTLDPPLASHAPDEGSGWGDACLQHALLRTWDPVLRGCLLSNHRQLKIISWRLKLLRGREDAWECGDHRRWFPAEMLKQRLEDLEQEKSSLHFQLPSRQPPLNSFLGHLAAQVQAALHHRATQQASSDASQAPLRTEPWPLEPTAQDSLHVSITRREWLLQEKQQLQKEIEALQARMSVLEAKDQQLRREIDEQEWQAQWRDCGLNALMGQLSLGQLQEVSQALQDTLASASQIPFCAEPPETIRSLQERIQSLNVSLKEITTKVCLSERLCSTLRKKVNDIDTQLPALLEAKMLAISGNHFCTAKDLTEEIRSLTLEREGLEGLLNKLLVLSSRNGKKLGSVKEDYNRLRRELEHQETAYEPAYFERTLQSSFTIPQSYCI